MSVCVSVCGMVAQVLALPPHSKKVLGSIPAWGAVGTGGRFSPGLRVSGGLSPRPFCVEFACSPRVHKGFLHKEPQQKNMQKNRSLSCPSLTKTGYEHLAWYKGCPLRLAALKEGQLGWVKGRGRISPATASACVCPVSPPIARVCCSVSCFVTTINDFDFI